VQLASSGTASPATCSHLCLVIKLAGDDDGSGFDLGRCWDVTETLSESQHGAVQHLAAEGSAANGSRYVQHAIWPGMCSGLSYVMRAAPDCVHILVAACQHFRPASAFCRHVPYARQVGQ
jgi:hypothetical protein